MRARPAWIAGAASLIAACGLVLSSATAEEEPAIGGPPTGAGFADAPFADQVSTKPTAAEWKVAPEVEPTRRGPRAAKCHVWRVREWVRVSCPDLVTASIAMLGGTVQGMAFWIDPVREGQDGKLPAGGEVLFPVRKGDRRVVQFLSFGPGYEGPFTQLPALVVQQAWLEGADRPVLLLH